MAKKSLVTRMDDERAPWRALTTCGKVVARRLTRAQSLLQADPGLSDAPMAQALHLGPATVERSRKRFVEAGLEAALTERPRPGGPRQREGTPEACLIALACRTAPEGRTGGTRQ